MLHLLQNNYYKRLLIRGNVMRTNKKLFLILSAIFILALTNIAAASTANINFNPSIVNLPEPGDTVTVYVKVEGARNLGGFQFDISYDPEIVTIENASDVALADFLNKSSKTFIPVGPAIDNTSGSLRFGGFIYGLGKGFNGNGSLARITFTVQKHALGILKIKSADFFNTSGTQSAVSVSGIAVLTDRGDGSKVLDELFDAAFDRFKEFLKSKNGYSARSSFDGVFAANALTFNTAALSFADAGISVSSNTTTSCDQFDFDGNGSVDVGDIMQVASRWNAKAGDSQYNSKYDFDGDGNITVGDIMQVAARWGCTIEVKPAVDINAVLKIIAEAKDLESAKEAVRQTFIFCGLGAEDDNGKQLNNSFEMFSITSLGVNFYATALLKKEKITIDKFTQNLASASSNSPNKPLSTSDIVNPLQTIINEAYNTNKYDLQYAPYLIIATQTNSVPATVPTLSGSTQLNSIQVALLQNIIFGSASIYIKTNNTITSNYISSKLFSVQNGEAASFYSSAGLWMKCAGIGILAVAAIFAAAPLVAGATVFTAGCLLMGVYIGTIAGYTYNAGVVMDKMAEANFPGTNQEVIAVQQPKTPEAKFTITVAQDKYKNITFNASGSKSKDGSALEYRWDWETDGIYDETDGGNWSSINKQITHGFTDGTHLVTLEVRDKNDYRSRAAQLVNVKNSPPNNPSNQSPVGTDCADNGKITLQWKSGDPDGDMVTYYIYFSSELDENGNPFYAGNIMSKQTDISCSMSAENRKSYYWLIVAQDEHNAIAFNQELWQFETCDTDLTASPVIDTFSINNGDATTSSRTVTLNNTCHNNAEYYMASEYSDFRDVTQWQPYSTAPSFRINSSDDGVKTVWFKVKNLIGESILTSDAITLTTSTGQAPMVITIAINGGALTTSSRTVTLDNICAGDPTEYMASESSTFSGASWQSYSTAPSFTLSASNGLKTVWFKVKNSYGESEVLSDTINLSTSTGQAPTVTNFAINNGASTTNSTAVTLNNTCSGNPTQYMASESLTFSGASWLPYSTAPSFTINSAGDGLKTVYFKVMNSIDESPSKWDTIILDTSGNGCPGSTPYLCPDGSCVVSQADCGGGGSGCCLNPASYLYCNQDVPWDRCCPSGSCPQGYYADYCPGMCYDIGCCTSICGPPLMRSECPYGDFEETPDGECPVIDKCRIICCHYVTKMGYTACEEKEEGFCIYDSMYADVWIGEAPCKSEDCTYY
jgi:hypothetical protein